MNKKVRTIIWALILALLPVVVAQAANPDGTLGHLRIEIIAAHNLVVDSNVTSPPTYAPKAATLGAKICNDGTETLHDVHAYIGDYIDGVNDTPGTYPVVDSDDGFRPADWTSDFMNNTGDYSLTHEAGSFGSASDASRAWVGTIEPGECKTEYWIVSYPQCVNVGGNPQSPPCDESITGGIKGDDDLTLSYDVWANGYYDNDASGGNSAGDTYLAADATRGLTLRNEISASANKIWPNGDNKVPDEYKEAIQELLGWDTWTPSGGYGAFPYPGETVRTQGVWYDLGNVGAGFDNDNDGVPDKNAWMQPVGDPSLYDAGCFRLVRTYGIVIVKQQGGTEHLIPFADQLYFENIPDNTGAIGLVFYEYAALNGVCRGALSPYQEVASGYDNEKFSGDYGTAIQMETREPLAFIAKNVFDDSLNPDPVLSGNAQTLVYQIEVTNPNIYTSGGQGLIVPLGDPLQGTPIVTRDSIPSGTEYIAGSAQFISNGTTTKTGKILFSADDGKSWSTIEPSPANTVTDIEWWLDEPLTSDDAAGENTMKVEFKVSVPGTYPDPYVTNIGCAAFGTGPCFDEDDAVTLVNGTNQIVGDLWEDTGSGNDYGDGEKDAGEAGVSGSVDIAVYYDTDDSGDYSEGDILWETVTTDGTGHYQTSTTLPDGKWVLVVGSLPSPTYDGWANTTDVVHVVDGLTGGETRQAPDTGYAPALILDKDVHNPADDSRIDDEDAGFMAPIDINEGDTVKYTIDVTNTLYDPGSGPTCTQDLWATTEDVSYGNAWTNPGEAYDSPPRNGNGAIAPFASNTDNLGLTTFALVPAQAGTITAVDIVVPLIKSTVFTGDGDNERVYFEIYDETDNLVIDGDGNPKYEFGPYDQPVVDGSCTVPCSGDFVITDILSDLPGTPTLADLANYDIVLVAKKNGPTPGGVLKVDSGAFQVTTDQSCGSTPRDSTIINPVPLEDTFDADELEFVSASPSPDRLTLIDPGNNIYRIEWDNLADSLGDLGPGDTHSVTVNFKALQPSTSPPAVQSPVTNTANVDSAKFKTGTPANTATDSVDVDLYHTAVIGDFIWNDENGDGLQAGETGLAGVDVFLCNSPVAGLPCDPIDPEYVTIATTDASGFYQFTGVTDGTYVLAVDTTDLPGVNFNTTPTGDPDATKDSQATLTITNSGDNLGQDWGYQSTRGTISGNVWEDNNGDAIQGTDDQGISGWTVELDNGSCTLGVNCLTIPTDASGNYSFNDLVPGTYTIYVNKGGSYTQIVDPSVAGVCSGGGCDDTSNSLTISGNENYTGVNFAYQTTGTNSIGNTLYVDLTGNAAWDQGGASTSAEPVIPNITVNLYEDNGTIGVLDAADILRATDVTDGNGTYGFTSLPDGDYLVVVDENDADFPQLTQTSDPDEDSQTTDLDSDTTVCTICDGQAVVNVNGANDTTVDFGYQPNGGMLGDSVYWDANGDGSQGQFEPGIAGVEVKLYTFTDTDGDGRWDIGEPRVDTNKTATTDAYGKYLFYGLPNDNYAVEVTSGAGTPIGTAELTADPGADGAVCPAAGSMCDEVHGVKIEGNNYMGADFGYQPPGVIGDQLFIDRDRSGGPMDGNDAPIAYVTVNLQDCGPNGTCGDGDDGPNQTTQTDDAGQYSFINLDIGSTFVITVDATAPDFPVDLLDPATYNGTSDTDGAVNNTSTVVATTEPIRDVDFGYPLKNINTLSGTVCLETAPNGVCGTGDNGIESGETAYSGTSVYVSKWTDSNADNVIDAGELIFLSQAATDGDGDYLFNGLPSVNGANESYLVSLSAPEDYLDLTTVAANTPADLLTENNESGTGYTTTAWQRVPAADGSNPVGLDFAFEEAANFDYGDLPSSYPTLKDDNGARHVVPAIPSLYLGATAPDTELDAVPDAAAQGDGADEDGISATPATWSEGLVIDGNGGSVQVTVTDDTTAGTGWLVAWIDFDGDSSFSTYGEMIISQKVSSGTQSYSFDIPTGTFDVSQGYARFRLFPEEPVIPELAYKGTAENGEVEDMRFNFGTGTIGDRVWLDENGDGVQDAGEAGISGVTVYIDDDGTPGYSAGDTQSVTDSNGNYLLKGVAPVTHTVLIKNDTLPAGLAANPTFDEDGIGTLHQMVTTHPLSAGENYLTADFGYNWASPTDTDTPTATTEGAIGDRIWNDADGDGVQDPNEAGIVGITVNLLTDDNNDGVYGGAGDSAAVTTITGPDGRYIFDDLASGSYVVEVDSTTLDTAGYNTLPTGDPDNTPDGKTTSPVVLAPGDVYVNADFGYTVNGGGSSIGDLIYLDTDASGTYSAVDTGIAGVSVVLEDASGNIIGTAITDESGAYRFNGLPDGNYTVKVLDSSNLLNGLSPTADPDGGADSESALNLSGSDNLDQDFGYAPEGHSNTEGLIGDTIFLDTGNGSGGAPDGDYDAGEGIQGVTVRLYDSVGALVAMTVTDVNGQYRFGNLDKNATYEVRVDTDTLPNSGIGLTNSVDPDNDGTVNRSTVNLSTETDGTAGDGVVLDQDFGYTVGTPNIISGTIWNDANADGTLDGSESNRLGGITVVLRDSKGNIVGTTVTDTSGNYSFGNLPDGDYTVEVDDRDGSLEGWWHSNGSNAGADNNSQTSGGYNVTVGGGQTDSTADFGYHRDGTSIGDLLWSDTNGNGINDGGEPPLVHYQIELTVEYPNGAITLTTLTDENGEYSFDNIMLDEDYNSASGSLSYKITVPSTGDLVSSHTITSDGFNDADGVTAADNQADNPDDEQVNGLVKGETDNTRDFGFVGGATIGDRIWLDLDRAGAGEGMQNIGDPGLSGITVKLYRDVDQDGFFEPGGDDGAAVLTTVTDGNGNYSFEGIPPGDYWVDVDETTLPTGLVAVTADLGGDDTLDSDLDADAGGATVVTVTSGEVVETQDFGYVGTSPLLGDTIWYDADGNGIQDLGEPGLKGVDVVIHPCGLDGICGNDDDNWGPDGVDNSGGGDDIADMTATTDAAGNYLKPVVPGAYSVTVTTGTLPAGLNVIPTNGTSSREYTVPADADILHADFGFELDGGTEYTIGNLIWEDDNGDGVKNAGETNGIAGVTVDLYRDGIPIATTTTAADGTYAFKVVETGADADYEVRVTDRDSILDGRTLTSGTANTNDNSQADPFIINDLTGDINYADFGYQGLNIGDRIWHDLNDNGIQDAGESGLNGVKVHLYLDNNEDGSFDGGDLLVRTTLTADGRYDFTGIPAGKYLVKLDPDNFTAGKALEDFKVVPADAGGDDQTDSDNPGSDGLNDSHVVAVELTGSSDYSTDFGFRYEPAAALYSIGDLVWLDTDAQGDQDAGEVGLEGITVSLYLDSNNDGKVDAGDQLLQVTTSSDGTTDVDGDTVNDPKGSYYFGNNPLTGTPGLANGEYLVVISNTDGGGLEGLYLTTGSINPHDVTIAGADVTDADFGLAPIVSTYAVFSSFKAYVNAKRQTVLEWTTASEIGTIGFFLERLNEQSGTYQAVNTKLLPSMLSPPHGGTYRYIDKAAKPGRKYTYRVVEVAVNSQGTISDPYTVQASKSLPVNSHMFAGGSEGYSLTHQDFSKKQLRRFAARGKIAFELAAAKRNKTGNILKVPVSKSGMVYLAATELAASSGIPHSQVVQYLKGGKCLVTLAGSSVSLITANTGSGIWFYGQAPDRNDIGQNVYLLELGKKGVKVKNMSGRAKEVVAEERSFVARAKVEENHQPIHLYINTPVKDFWAWEYMFAYGTEASLNHNVDSPYMTGEGEVVLTVNLVGMTNSNSGQEAPYKVAVFLNDVEVGTAEWSEQGDYTFQGKVSADLLREGGNEVRLVSQLNSGVVYSFIYLDSFELDYQRSYQAVNGELIFANAGYDSITVQGFSSSNVLALDTTNPNKPLRLRTLPGKNEAGEYTITILAKPEHNYFMTENIGLTVSSDITVDSPSQLHNRDNHADYLVISPLNMMSSAQRLADYRAAQGMTAMTIDIEDIQDEFSHALAAPEAVHKFLAYVYENWSIPPQYVVLIGDGSYDYKDYLGYGYPVVPTELVATEDGFFPSDNRFADVVGDDGIPEFAIGRIPVVNSLELNEYIEKLISYEQGASYGENSVLNLVTDRADSTAGDFRASAAKIAELMPKSFSVNHLDAGSLGNGETHSGVAAALRQGGGIMHYVGHSSLIAFGRSSSLLTASEIESMSGTGSPMLMVSMACSTASFGYPAMRSIGEAAVLRADGVAAGFFGATGLSKNYLADIMAEGFYRGLLDPTTFGVGDAVVKAKRDYAAQGLSNDPLYIYNFLGDPAMSVPAGSR